MTSEDVQRFFLRYKNRNKVSIYIKAMYPTKKDPFHNFYYESLIADNFIYKSHYLVTVSFCHFCSDNKKNVYNEEEVVWFLGILHKKRTNETNHTKHTKHLQSDKG